MSVTKTEAQEKINHIIKDIRIAMLTSVDAKGDYHSRPMYTMEAEFDGDVWFFADKTSGKVADIERNPKVNVSYAKGSSYVSLAGKATIYTGIPKKKELWNEALKVWFKNGPEDPNVVLLKISARSAEYWDENAPGGPIGTALSFIKALLSNDPEEIGENERVTLK